MTSKTRSFSRLFGAAMVTVILGGLVMTTTPARASEEGRRNTTLGMGALTGYLFTRRGNKVPAFIGAAGTAYSYKRYQDSINNRHRRERQRAEARRYHRSSASARRYHRSRRHHRR